MVRELKKNGISHIQISLDDRRLPVVFFSRYRLGRLLRRESFDLIHAHARIPAFLLSSLARKNAIPLVTTVHASFRCDGVSRFLSRWGDRSIAVSEDLRQYLAEEYAVPPSRVTVILNGVDVERFWPRGDRKRERFRLTFASRLDFDCSDVAYGLCRLAKRLDAALPEIEILLCGGGEALSSLRRMAEKVNGETGKQTVCVTGRIERMPELLSSSDVVCGVSRVAMEAMACGVPVILGGNEGYLGLLTSSEFERMACTNFCCREERKLTDERLYRSILTAARLTSEERKELGQALRRLALDRLSSDGMAERIRGVYRETLEEYSRRGDGILIGGYYGFGNLGDDALLRAAVARAKKEYPEEKITVLTARGRRDEASFGVRCISRRNPFLLFRSLARARLFVLGGGTLLQDRSSLRSLLFYSGLIRLAARHGAECQLWGNGIGPIDREIGRRQTAKALRCCSVIECRDRPSAREAKTLLAKKEVKPIGLTADLAENTLPCEPSREGFLLRRLFGETVPSFVAVAVRGREGRGYQRLMEEWLSVLRGQGMELLFVTMFPKEDRRATERLCRTLGGRILTGADERDLTALLRHAQAVCGMRLHALILASVAGVPFVGFGGEEKIRAFCRERGGIYFTELYRSK